MSTVEATTPATATPASTRRRAAREAEAPERHERPHQVELLLDRERPEVAERRRAREEVEVRLARRDEPPVRDVEEAGDAVAAEPSELVGRDLDPGEDRHRDDHEQQGRQQPAGAPAPERQQPDALVAAPFEHQQGGDEEAAQHEEGVHAEEPTGEPLLVEVEGDHCRHGQGPQPVERRLVGERVGRGLRSGRRHARGWYRRSGVPPGRSGDGPDDRYRRSRVHHERAAPMARARGRGPRRRGGARGRARTGAGPPRAGTASTA